MCLSLRMDSRKKANRRSMFARSPMLPLCSWATTQSSTLTRRRSCSTLSPSHFNTISITLPKEQSEEFKRILDETKREKVSYSEYEGEIQFKVKLSPNTKIVNNDKKPIKIDLRNVPCADLREYKDSTIDIVLTGSSNEFEGKNGEKFSFTSLSATQIKVKCMNSVYECDFL